MNEYLTAVFWHGEQTHVACSPGESAEGLATRMERAHGSQGWCLFQTSGTEGQRKWVGLTKAAMLVSARAVNAHFAVTTADRWLLALPLWHVGGFGILARAFTADVPVETLSGKWDVKAFASFLFFYVSLLFLLSLLLLNCPKVSRVREKNNESA